MRAIRTQWEGAAWFDWGLTYSLKSQNKLRISDQSAGSSYAATDVYAVNQRVKIVSNNATVYGSVTTLSSSSTAVIIDVTPDSGTLTSTITSVAVSIIKPSSASESPIPTSDLGSGDASGVTKNITQATHGLSTAEVVRLSGASTYTTAQGDSAANAEAVGFVQTVSSTTSFVLQTAGHIDSLTGLTANTVYFLDPASAGGLTATEPTTVGSIIKPVLVTDTTTSGYILTYRGNAVEAGGGGAATQADMEAATSTTTYVTPGRAQYHPGAGKGWLYMTYTTGTPGITASHNVTSLDDDGTGLMTINWTTDFSSANYAVVMMGEEGAAERCVWQTYRTTPRAVGSIQVECEAGGALGVDRPGNFIAMGDQ